MMKKFLLPVALLSVVGLSGCVIAVGTDEFDDYDSVHKREKKTRSAIAELPLGLGYEAVRDKLGEPDFSEAFTGKDGEYRAYFYRTHRTHSDGDTTRDETTPLVFKDGKLVAFGQDAYRNALEK